MSEFRAVARQPEIGPANPSALPRIDLRGLSSKRLFTPQTGSESGSSRSMMEGMQWPLRVWDRKMATLLLRTIRNHARLHTQTTVFENATEAGSAIKIEMNSAEGDEVAHQRECERLSGRRPGSMARTIHVPFIDVSSQSSACPRPGHARWDGWSPETVRSPTPHVICRRQVKCGVGFKATLPPDQLPDSWWSTNRSAQSGKSRRMCGLSSLAGSRAVDLDAMTSRSTALRASAIQGAFTRPTPCSALMLPSCRATR